MSFQWYRAHKVLALIFAIGNALSIVALLFAASFFSSVGDASLDPYLDSIVPLFRGLLWVSVLVCAVQCALLFATFFAQQVYSRACVPLVFAINLIMPATSIGTALACSRFLSQFLLIMEDLSFDPLGTQLASSFFFSTIVGAGVIGAIILFVLLLLNSIYFFKRRDLLGQGRPPEPPPPPAPYYPPY